MENELIVKIDRVGDMIRATMTYLDKYTIERNTSINRTIDIYKLHGNMINSILKSVQKDKKNIPLGKRRRLENVARDMFTREWKTYRSQANG